MYFDYLETFTITLIFFSVLVGGIVKGSVSIGMSMFSVPIIAFILPPTKAMMLLCFPVVLTDLIQMNIQKGINDYRFFPMFLMLFVGILIGGKLFFHLIFRQFQLSLH
jgi:Sulfite exporter TauE/SafE.